MSAATYMPRQSPVTAIRYDGTNAAAIAVWVGGGDFHEVDPEDRTDDPDMTASLLDYRHSTWVGVKVGTWIVRDSTGSFEAMDDATFTAAYYEPIAATSHSIAHTVTLTGTAVADALDARLLKDARTR